MDLYAELERPLIAVLARMERAGIAVDVPRLKQLSREFAERIAAIETQVYSHGRPHLQHQLRAAAPPGALRRAEAAVAAEDARAASRARRRRCSRSSRSSTPCPALLIQHRQLSKLKSTYLDALPELVHPEDGRIHASFNQSVAATGRLSSSDPNLQNIPVRTRGRSPDPPGVRRRPARVRCS